MASYEHYLLIAGLLFSIGLLGVLIRRNLVVVLLCIELMLNAVNLIFVSASHFLGAGEGLMFVFFVLTVSAAEVAVGLALVISL
ncbi:MAG: NADH-quinone oxidoreductase subunit NuoK [bacterium]